MSILVDRRTRVLVQGITGRDGSFHSRAMMEYGTQVVAGVTPGKGGSLQDGVPVYDTVIEAAEAQHADTALIFVPPAGAADAILEAASSPRIKLIVCITEGVPVLDTARVMDQLKRRPSPPRLIGPNCPGLISPGRCKVGIMPGHIHVEGRVGVVSRSGTLTYEVVHQLTTNGIGQSTCIGIGGDPLIGTSFIHALEAFEADPGTEAVVMIGEIGGSDEEEAARFIGEKMSKPVVGFIAGLTAPPGKRMGHAGAIVSGGSGTAADKITALENVGVPVAGIPSEIPVFVRKMLGERRPTAAPAVRREAGPRGPRVGGRPAPRAAASGQGRGYRGGPSSSSEPRRGYRGGQASSSEPRRGYRGGQAATSDPRRGPRRPDEAPRRGQGAVGGPRGRAQGPSRPGYG
ncbi:MAG: succinate--CoA ligase subunit alpha, partial [Candidatus Eisenbacteria bacterium]|nr:succinate--CoA ligase subunit alpha [Candidatus Eisenbacteria bacterium]